MQYISAGILGVLSGMMLSKVLRPSYPRYSTVLHPQLLPLCWPIISSCYDIELLSTDLSAGRICRAIELENINY
jgi:hypothetical protein